MENEGQLKNVSSNLLVENVSVCPKCSSNRIWKDGLRDLNDGSKTQIFLCRDCGYRFSKGHISSNSVNSLGSNRQLCAKAKKLDSATEIKTVVGDKNELIEYAWRCKKKGNSDKTIAQRCYILELLQKKGAVLSNPDSVETILATEPEYDEKNYRSKKYNAVKAYVTYTKRMKIYWEPITVKYEAKDAFIPTIEELRLFIDSAGHRFGTYLQVLYDTGARRGEVAHIKWRDINTENHTISINDPEKHSRCRTIKVPESTLVRIQTLTRKHDPYIFCPREASLGSQFLILRKRLFREYNNPRLLQIHIHLFRYNFAHKLIKQQKHLKEVQQKLGHKSSSSTDRYTNTVVFNEFDYEIVRVTTVDDAEKYGQLGYTKYDEINSVHLYRRLRA
jgi:integrase